MFSVAGFGLVCNQSESLDEFGHKLVLWYEAHHRALPWRQTSDPYRILVSETMLQQTRVETVIPYYHRFLERFPDISSLAAAEESDVLKLWQGLGYYSRARNLQRAAKAVCEQHGGEIPADAELVRALPGVGPYTTGAVMSIAFNQPVAAVDGNVLRVMARYLGIEEPIDEARVKLDIEKQVQQMVEGSVPRLFTQALMELGAVVCTPKRVQCLVCPVRDGCVATATGRTAELPRRKPKKARKQYAIMALWLEQDGHLLVEQRPDTGLLADMWQLPMVEMTASKATADNLLLAAERRLATLLDVDTDAVVVRETPDGEAAQKFVQIATARHIFTHLEWDVSVLRPVGLHNVRLSQSETGALRFVPLADLKKLVWPKVYENILHEVLDIDVAH
ncbi:A/G-specific adenine glycosylase [Alicyclobacillus fodiniaquatilis]|uniref:Adenine DNA glycosylase n=1 Tax=Alicyclobacillus fodiniaquatilis TaxID=1661150 RepID=A0ABW4JTI7_9BACL